MRRSFRFIKIAHTFAKYRLDKFLPVEQLPLHWRALLKIAPWRVMPHKESDAIRLRLALESLGPIFIKFGQLLSTRRDLLSDELAFELQKLQDQVPPFDSDTSIQLIETALNKSINDVFEDFDSTPLASASVAQVHAATLYSGEDVVVKVVRPGIDKIIASDIQLMYLAAQLLEKYSIDGRRLRPVEIINDYEKTIFDELDLMREAANASQLRRNWENSDLMYVPEVHWPHTNKNVMVMERIYGTPVTDIAALEAAGTDMKKLAERGVEIFFTQVFRDSFFHADMHPGNIFINITEPDNPRYIAIDCAIIGSLTPEDQNYLAKNLLAFFNRDYHEVAQLHIDSGWVPENTKVNEFEFAIRSVCEPIFEKPLKDISFGQVLLRLFQTARRFDMEVQPQLVLLQKTLLNIEGLGRQLYPELDLWTTAKPYLEKAIKERMGPRGLLKAFIEQAPEWLDQLPQAPQLVFDALQQIKNMDKLAKEQRQTIEKLHKELEKSNRVKSQPVLGCVALVLAGVLVYRPELVDLSAGVLPSLVLGGFGVYWLFKRA